MKGFEGWKREAYPDILVTRERERDGERGRDELYCKGKILKNRRVKSDVVYCGARESGAGSAGA